MRRILTITLSVACGIASAAALAQDVSDPGCAAIEEWVSTLSTNRSRMAVQERGELRDQALTDERTEPVFGLGYSRWQLPQLETAGSALTRCQAEAQQRGDTDAAYQMTQMNARIQDRIRRSQRMTVNNPTPATTAPAKVVQPDCETHEVWAGILMTQQERGQAIKDGLNDVEMDQQRRALLLSDAEIEPRFGYPLSEWNYNDYSYASAQVSRCGAEAGAAGDRDSQFQLRTAFGIIRRLGNEMR